MTYLLGATTLVPSLALSGIALSTGGRAATA